MQIHESADIAGRSPVLGRRRRSLSRLRSSTTLKRHNPKTVRKNTADDYHGCLCVYVRRSADLNLRIAGWFEGIAEGAIRIVSGDTVEVQRSGVV